VRPDEVPAGPLLVDTDVFSWVTWRRNRHEEYAELIAGHVLAVSFATVAELRQGALMANFGDRRRDMLEDKIRRHYVVLTATDAVTSWYARLAVRFRDQLKGGGVNDMWIAATALAQAAPLPVVTGNRSDFGRIATEFPLQVIGPDE